MGKATPNQLLTRIYFDVISSGIFRHAPLIVNGELCARPMDVFLVSRT